MDKKVLKMYEAPAVELVELNVNGSLLVGSPNAKGVTEDEWDDEEG